MTAINNDLAAYLLNHITAESDEPSLLLARLVDEHKMADTEIGRVGQDYVARLKIGDDDVIINANNAYTQVLTASNHAGSEAWDATAAQLISEIPR